MSGARRWLAEHAAGSPVMLFTAMERALAGEREGAPVAEALAAAGLGVLGAVVGGEGGRGSAVDLLAADALLTCACQAAAGEGGSAVEALTSSLDLSRFEALLAGEAA